MAVEDLRRIDPAGLRQRLGEAAVGIVVEKEADAVAARLRRVGGVGFLEQRHRLVPEREHRIALAEVGQDRGVVRVEHAAGLQRFQRALDIGREPARQPEGVAGPARVRGKLDRAGRERQRPLARVRLRRADRVAEPEGVAVDQGQAGQRLGVVGLVGHGALEADPHRLDHRAVEGPPVGVEEQHRRIAAEHLRGLSVGIARPVGLDRAVGLRQRPCHPVRHLVAERDDLGWLQPPLVTVGPDGAAARGIDEQHVHLEAVRPERGLAGDQVVGGKVARGRPGIDAGRMAQRRIRAEHPQAGEAGERDDQRPREPAGEGREGRLVAFLVEGGHQHPRRAGRRVRQRRGLGR